jgi:hypothetical protein
VSGLTEDFFLPCRLGAVRESASAKGEIVSEHIEEAEDLTLEVADSEAVTGGRVNVDPGDESAYVLESELAALKAKGFVQKSCTPDGALMVNAKGQTQLLRFV